MFPEFHAQITQLKQDNPHFERLYEKHADLDQRIQKIEDGKETGTPLDVEKLKKEKLHLKDQIYAMLKQSS